MPNSPRATADDDGKQDSYLMQYLRSLPEEKRLMMEESLVNEINVNDQALANGHVGGSTQGARKHKNGGDAKEDPSSKKSSSCIVL